jgi:hypothetical protein
VVAELARDPETLATTEMHVNSGYDEKINDNKLWREKLFQHIPFL